VANFVVRACAPSPRIDLAVADPETGSPRRVTTYRGVVDISVDTNVGPSMTSGDVQLLLPDSLEYGRDDAAGGVAAATVAPLGHAPIVTDTRVLVHGVAAAFVEGAEGTQRLVLNIGLETTMLLDAYTVRLGYEATAVVPHR
jgi:hypothetical protein